MPKPKPLYLVAQALAHEVELPIETCDLSRQLSIAYSPLKGKYLVRATTGDYRRDRPFPGCGKYYDDGTLTLFWMDSLGAVETERLKLPPPGPGRDIEVAWTRIGWVVDLNGRIVVADKGQWVTLYEDAASDRVNYKLTSVSPDGCLLGIHVQGFDRTGHERAHYSDKQFRVLDVCVHR